MPEPTSNVQFAGFFNALLESAGLSGAQAARRLGVAQSQVSRWRRGEGGITLENLERIAKEFSIDRSTLEQLAGFRDTYGAATQDTADQEIKALLDAERAETHEELKGVEPQFWPIIIEAGRVARQAAAKVARMAAPQSISDPSSLPNSATANRHGELKRGGDRASGKPKSGGYLLAAAG